ncbi:DUF38 domain-containing protein [Caenorhabditis elegans]|uniref:DUF38 domain-containing protein n=1 Tax=Caenorhabditis elegans TaxID=6239 RepID=Q18059_CAEEL|nr:DUF38 domain-containing protein [Caenorhabditis elegans]CCD64837.1 DUF38 domain-containing protein [Caenorhabditis elegans]|eukprot:NP_495070.1 Uncharacterized protein CELE_C17C3.5 [Caenorhabditis elegans]
MDFDNFPIEQLSHLISFDIEWTETSVADAIKIKDIILRSPHFESASILSHCVNKIKPEVLKVFHPNYIATDRDYNEMLELRNDYFRSIVYAGGSSIDIYNVNLEDPDDFE